MEIYTELIWLVLIVICVVATIIGSLLLANRQRSRMMRAFASLHGWQYQPKAEKPLASDSTFINSSIHSSKLMNTVSGQWQGRPAWAAQINGNVFTSRQHNDYEYTVAAIQVAGTLPPFVLIPRGETAPYFYNDPTLQRAYGGGVTQLEGNFGNSFDVRVSDELNLELREVLTPDIMVMLQNRGTNYCFEFSQNHVFAYRADSPESAELAEIFTLLTDVIDRLTTETAAFTHDPVVDHANARGAYLQPFWSANGMKILLVVGALVAFIVWFYLDQASK